jgi:hypothetical protein
MKVSINYVEDYGYILCKTRIAISSLVLYREQALLCSVLWECFTRKRIW